MHSLFLSLDSKPMGVDSPESPGDDQNYMQS